MKTEIKKVILKQIEWPSFGMASPLAPPSVEELKERLGHCRRKMEEYGFSHLIVYGDREHFANLMYLTHFDPRFEEALLVISREGTPLMLVGNECVGHLGQSPLYQVGGLRYERYQPFSLLSQPRNDSRPLKEIFEEEAINKLSRVGCVGWKYFGKVEFAEPEFRIELPHFVVDILHELCEKRQVVNATDLLMSPASGLRSICSPYEIALFEQANVLASEGMKNLLSNFRTGVSDYELVREYGYCGLPLNCHIGIKSSGNLHYGLTSPTGDLIRLGDPCSTNIGYWGSNICRAGWVAASEADLPSTAHGYVEEFAAPYFQACREWYRQLRIGTPGHLLQDLINESLPFDRFGVFLNPGHLIHLDEWLSSPIYPGSMDKLRSGMYLQVDIIPRSASYFSSRMEEGVVLADEALRKELNERYPEVYQRCMARRKFMIEVLGFELSEEVLPLSNIPGLVPPFFLDYRTVLAFE